MKKNKNLRIFDDLLHTREEEKKLRSLKRFFALDNKSYRCEHMLIECQHQNCVVSNATYQSISL